MSITYFLSTRYDAVELGDRRVYHVFRCPDAVAKYFAMTVIRHPLSRFVSMYHHAVTEYQWTRSFAETVRLLAKPGDGKKLPLESDFWLPQTAKIQEAVRPPKLLSYETLLDDLAALPFIRESATELSTLLPHLHQHVAAYDPAEYYTAELLRLITNVYADDFAAFPQYEPTIRAIRRTE